MLAVHDEHLGRDVALKELRGRRRQGGKPTASAVARFLREARITAQLEHPNIVPVHEIGRRPDGTLYYTMKLVRGRTLDQAIAAATSLDERLALLPRFVDLCDAIGYAHSRGVVHRDIKPANVMVGAFGETVVLDWGLAKARGDDDVDSADEAPAAGDAGRTMDGSVLGTPAYMSPEQAAGDVARVDERSDTWALGVVLFEILAGRRAFAGDPQSVLERVRDEAPPRAREAIPDVPPELAAIVDKALSRAREDRYPDAGALARDVEAWRSGGRVGAYRYSSWDLVRRFVAQNRAPVTVGVVAAVLLAITGLVSGIDVVAERDRALDAEARARDDQQRALVGLADGLADKAAGALERDDVAAASVYAAGALAIAERPDARGVVALARARWAPTIERVVPLGKDARSLYWAPDGTWLLCVSPTSLTRVDRDGAVRWRVTVEGGVKSAAIARDGSLLAVGHDEGVVQVLDGATGAERASIDQGGGYVSALAFTPDGRGLVGAGKVYDAGSGLVTWDVGTGERIGFLPEAGSVYAIAFSPDGRTLAWESADGVHLRTADGSERTVPQLGLSSVAWSPDGRTLAASVGDGSTLVVPAEGGPARYLPGDGGTGLVGWSSDGRLLLDTRERGRARLLDAATGARVLTLPEELPSARSAAFSPAAPEIAAVDTGGDVRLWRYADPPPPDGLYRLGQGGASLQWTADGKVLCDDGEGAVGVWDPVSGRLLARLDGGGGAPHVSRRGDRIAVLHGDGGVDVFDARTLARLSSFATPRSRQIAWVDDDSRLAVLDFDGVVTLRDPATGAEGARYRGQGVTFVWIEAAEGGRALVCGTSDDVRVWRVDLATGDVAPIPGISDEATTFWAMSDDGRTLALTYATGEVVAWDVRTGQELRRVRVDDGYPRRLAVSSDGRRAVVGGANERLYVVDLTTGRVPAILDVHRGRLQAMAFAPDGRTAVSSDWQSRIRRWDVASIDADGEQLLAEAEARFGLLLDGATLRSRAAAGP